MNWDAIGAVGDLVSGVGVIVTLAYFAAQVRLNSRQVEDAARVARSQLLSDGYQLSIDGLRAPTEGRLNEAWSKAMASSTDLSDGDLVAVEYFLVSEWLSSLRQLRIVDLGVAPETTVEQVAHKWVGLYLGNDCALRWWASRPPLAHATRPDLCDAIDHLLQAEPLTRRTRHANQLTTMRSGPLPAGMDVRA